MKIVECGCQFSESGIVQRCSEHENQMGRLAHALGVPESVCWEAFDERGERPEWLPLAIRNVLRGRTQKHDGTPYDPDWFDSIWTALQRLNTRTELAGALNSRQGSAALSDGIFGNGIVGTMTGRIRSGTSYTESRNTPFQGLASDGAKLALFRLVAADYRVVGFVHDEVLIELPVQADYTDEISRIDKIMCDAMKEVTGSVPVQCEAVLTTRWSKDAKPVHDDQGRLIPWQPE